MELVLNNWDKITTAFFAGLSALFVGITVVLTYLNYRRDNPKIKVNISTGFLTYSGSVVTDCMICRITNFGRRQVIINQIYLSLSNNGNLFFLDNCSLIANTGVYFPFKLSERESVDVDLIVEELKDSLLKNKAKLKAVCFRDSTGVVYKANVKNNKWKRLYK